MFSDHTYLSNNEIIIESFKNLRDEIIINFSVNEKKKILDLGSNDGTF